MRYLSLISIIASIVLMGAAAPDTVMAPPAVTCPSIYTFEQYGADEANTYLLVIGAQAVATVHLAATLYDGRTGYSADLPSVSISKDADARRFRARSSALVLHVPASIDSPSILVRYPDASSACAVSGARLDAKSDRVDTSAMLKGVAADIHAEIASEAAVATPLRLAFDATAALTCHEPAASASSITVATPGYPDSAAMLHRGGTSLISVSIDPNGNVMNALVYRSSGNAALDRSAIEAARASTYRPQVIACQAVAGTYLFRAVFTPPQNQ